MAEVWQGAESGKEVLAQNEPTLREEGYTRPAEAACFDRGNSDRMSDRGSGHFRSVSAEITLILRSSPMIRERIAGIAVAGVTNS